MTLLQTTGVTVRYGGVTAVDAVDFDVAAGSLHGVIGPNGAGKSTFMDALSGRRRLAAGNVILEGADITKQSPGWRRLHGISRSFQQTSVFPAMTVATQLELVARRTRERNVDVVIDALGLRKYLHQRCDSISYGDQRRVDIAMALVGHPRVVLLDEPAAGLAADEATRMLDHVRELCNEWKVAAVLVEHDVEGVFRVCDRVTVLALGKILASGEPQAVRKDPAVIKAYLGSAA